MLPAHVTFAFNILLLKMEAKRRQQQAIERRRRRFMNHKHGVYFTLYLELRRLPDRFFEFFHMSVDNFDDLLLRVAPRIQSYLATGESIDSLYFQFQLRKSIICCIIQDTCLILWDVLKGEFLPLPLTQHWNDAAETFLQETQFPNCVGALDGKHIRIQKPQESASEFLNSKNYFSIILMAIADAKCRFVAVEIGGYGRTYGFSEFRASIIGQSLYSGELGFPAPRPFPGTDGPRMPFVLVGNKSYQMCGNLLNPYSSRGLNYRKRIFNHRLSKARQQVESAFGILTAKWRILARAIQLSPEGAHQVVKACVILHNYFLSREPLAICPKEMASNLDSINSVGPRSIVTVNQIRNQFAEYCMSNAGWVDWQEHIH